MFSVTNTGLNTFPLCTLKVSPTKSGVITDWQGKDPLRGNSIVAAGSSALHREVLAALNAKAGR